MIPAVIGGATGCAQLQCSPTPGGCPEHLTPAWHWHPTYMSPATPCMLGGASLQVKLSAGTHIWTPLRGPEHLPQQCRAQANSYSFSVLPCVPWLAGSLCWSSLQAHLSHHCPQLLPQCTVGGPFPMGWLSTQAKSCVPAARSSTVLNSSLLVVQPHEHRSRTSSRPHNYTTRLFPQGVLWGLNCVV